MARVIFLCTILAYAHSFIHGEESLYHFIPPEDNQDYWVVGISTFIGSNLSKENEYLTYSIPRLIMENLESIQSHFFSEKEIACYKKEIILKDQRRLGKELDRDRKERDELFFSNLQSPVKDEKLTAYKRRIEETVDRLNYLKALDIEEILFSSSKPIRFKTSEETGQLLKAPIYSPLKMARQNGINLLIWGSFKEVQDYLYFEVRALDSVAERQVFSFKHAALREDISQSFDEIVNELSQVLWGRDFAVLNIKCDPPESTVYLDGEYIGKGEVLLKFLVPGEKEIKISHPGYMESKIIVDLIPYTTFEHSVVLEKKEPEKIFVQSYPSGAAVYSGSMWIGNTPLEVDKPQNLLRFLLKKDGSNDLPVYLDSYADDLFLSMPDSFDAVVIQKNKRDAFYASFGVFALSLPLPVFLWSYTNDYALAAQAAYTGGNYTEALRLIGVHNNYYNAYLGCTAVSISLFINMMVTLIKYIRSADRKAG